MLNQFVYGRPISKAKWLCLIPVIGGVIIASLKELDFAVSALIAACSANLFAAFKGNENKKLMETKGLKDRLGTVGNQFAVTQIMAFIMSLPLLYLTEGSKWGEFRETLSLNSGEEQLPLLGPLLLRLQRARDDDDQEGRTPSRSPWRTRRSASS